jgi:hypothetical protein
VNRDLECVILAVKEQRLQVGKILSEKFILIIGTAFLKTSAHSAHGTLGKMSGVSVGRVLTYCHTSQQ